MPAFIQPIDIRFADLDALGHVNSGKIIEYAEHARVNWLLQNGAKTSAELPIIVASVHAEYHAPIAKSDAIEVAMHVPRIGTKSWDFQYHVRSTDGKTLFATITTVQVAYDYAQNASVAIPATLRARLEALHP